MQTSVEYCERLGDKGGLTSPDFNRADLRGKLIISLVTGFVLPAVEETDRRFKPAMLFDGVDVDEVWIGVS